MTVSDKSSKTQPRQSAIIIALLMVFLCFILTQCSKSSSTNGNTQPPVTAQAAYTVQADFTDATLSNQHHRAARQADGKIVAAQSDGGLVRIGTDGKPDVSFLKLNFADNSVISNIAIQADGKILLSGRLNITNHLFIARLMPDGSLDNSFNAFALDGVPSALLVRADKKILVAGTFSYLQNGTLKYHIMRLNEDGSLDNTFACELGFSNNGATCLVQGPDNKIIIGGVNLSYNKSGLQTRCIVKLNENGTVDGLFNFPLQIINPAGTATVQALALDKDGKVLMGGAFYSIGQSAADKTDYNSLARLNVDGTLDKTFLSPTAGSDFVNAIKPLDNGNILVGRRIKTVLFDVTDFFTVLDSKGAVNDFRLGYKQGGVDAIVQESATSFVLVGAFKPATGQYGLVRIVQK